ncbi:nickel pincer cofactor biosynthesis protein LarC [Candidatus Contubernalis alkaliaceticus]|uniref:nickel pincer cofactor biosynthesis protein LarC n=1 Tax=Candidatus Contubernalis alkaliaceticus TaxID=338645 RepID=UPI001F4C0EE7|nr:nickel pincer cofactor biosynthesis protein LarC [Candidatus Contubernalis alkalaceticus]UNC91362.1 nickel pincer cofactor biosynthesis protein LarC [Candidatus Contubernalis alkalaceticus]
MNSLYFQCFSGISGDMILGAFLDLGLDLEELKRELEKLNLVGYELEAKKVKKTGISGTKFDVVIKEKQTKHRHFSDINNIIGKSQLEQNIKDLSLKIFQKLAQAEAKIHGTTIERVHFHEVGGIDTIIDIVGACICLQKFKIEKIYCSKINVGSGYVRCQHGIMPVPAPATQELLTNIPIYSFLADKELVTPTGAAIISTICSSFSGLPEFVVSKIGYGAGKMDLELPNMLRLLLGTSK